VESRGSGKSRTALGTPKSRTALGTPTRKKRESKLRIIKEKDQ